MDIEETINKIQQLSNWKCRIRRKSLADQERILQNRCDKLGISPVYKGEVT